MAQRQTMGAMLLTAEELEKFPDDDYRYELVEGRLIRMSPVGWQHGRIVARLLGTLDRYAREHDLGVAVTEVGFKLRSSPDTVRAPDVAFVRRERLPAADARGFISGAPDVAIEVFSPDDRAADIRAKIEDYLRHGVTVAVIIDPDEHTVAIHRRLAPAVVLAESDALFELGDLIPGFTCTLADIFKG